MTISRRADKYKYPSDPSALNGRKATQELIDGLNKFEFALFKKTKEKICWIVRFRQKDLIEKLNHHFKEVAKQSGHCQVITTMYMHLREMTKDNPELGYRLFKYWCFMDAESVIELSKQDNKNGYFLQGFLRGNKNFLHDFFDPNGKYSLPNVALNFWGNHTARKQSSKGNQVTALSYQTVPEGESFEFVPLTKPLVDFQGTDDYDFLCEYEPNYILKNNVVYTNAQNCIGMVIVREIEHFKAEEEMRILINLKNKSGDDSHSVSITRFNDALEHLEFVDGNRGVFLLPNDLNKIKEFFKDYFNQSIYESFAFSVIQIESYGYIKNEDQLSPKSQAVQSLATQRRKSSEDARNQLNTSVGGQKHG